MSVSCRRKEKGLTPAGLAGAPAAMSKRFQKGDIVLEVDGVAATNKNIVQLLIGPDVPGTIVSIKCQRKAEPEPFEVALKRACTADLADKKVGGGISLGRR
jgi:C-terminal processing protease CtpA/Prc